MSDRRLDVNRPGASTEPTRFNRIRCCASRKISCSAHRCVVTRQNYICNMPPCTTNRDAARLTATNNVDNSITVASEVKVAHDGSQPATSSRQPNLSALYFAKLLSHAASLFICCRSASVIHSTVSGYAPNYIHNAPPRCIVDRWNLRS